MTYKIKAFCCESYVVVLSERESKMSNGIALFRGLFFFSFIRGPYVLRFARSVRRTGPTPGLSNVERLNRNGSRRGAPGSKPARRMSKLPLPAISRTGTILWMRENSGTLRGMLHAVHYLLAEVFYLAALSGVRLVAESVIVIRRT